MKMLNMGDFLLEAGIPMPIGSRDMSAYNGNPFDCACGKKHIFDSSLLFFRNYATNGANAKMMVTCPNNSRVSTLIKTKYKFLVVFDKFESLAGNIDYD